MRKKQKVIILLATAWMLCAGTIQAQETSLLVHSGDGTPQSFTLSSIAKITFSEGNLNVLSKSGTSNDVALSTISRLTFAADGGSKIISPDVSKLTLYPNPVHNELFVTSDAEIESIAVFGLDGSVLLQSRVQSSSATLQLGFLPKGIYLIQVKRADAISTQKIIKQ
jgi:hypothetical protein